VTDGPASRRAVLKKTVDFALMGAARRIVEAISVVPGETVIIVYDQARETIASAIVDAVQMLPAKVETFMLENLGARPLQAVPDPLREGMGRAQASVMLIGVDDERELPLRREFVTLVESLKLRHAHVIGVTRGALIAGFNVEPARIVDMTRQVRLRITGRASFRYRTGYGTDLEVTLDPDARWGEHVGIIRPGRWENLPAGQLFTWPKDVRGVFVANASLDISFKGQSPSVQTAAVRFEIEEGRCRAVTSDDAELAQSVDRYLRATPDLDRVGQVALGTNPGLMSPIGEPVFDQCVPGLHLVFGWTNPKVTGAPWVANAILSANGAGGDLEVDGKALMRAGRYLL